MSDILGVNLVDGWQGTFNIFSLVILSDSFERAFAWRYTFALLVALGLHTSLLFAWRFDFGRQIVIIERVRSSSLI